MAKMYSTFSLVARKKKKRKDKIWKEETGRGKLEISINRNDCFEVFWI